VIEGSRRLWMLGGLVAVLAAVYVLVHGVPGLSGRDSADAEDIEARAPEPPGVDRSAGSGEQPAALPRDVKELSRQRDPRNLPKLRQAASAKAWKTRHAAVAGIGKLASKGAPKFLVSVLANKAERPEVRAAAAESLGAMRYYDAGPALMDAMEDGSKLVRAAAGMAMRRITRMHCGFRAGDSAERRRNAVQLVRKNWPPFYAFIKSKGR